jgi:hypothetical protein
MLAFFAELKDVLNDYEEIYPRENTSRNGKTKWKTAGNGCCPRGPFRGSPRARDDQNLPHPYELKSATVDPRGADRANRKGDLDPAAHGVS